MTVAELKALKSKNKLHPYMQEYLEDLIKDPDEGLELTESFKRALQRAAKTPKEKYISHEELKRRLGIP